MIEALWDFFGLYKAGSDYLPGFWLTMLLLYLNAGLYLADLYHLVKRKSKAETVSLMAIPGIFAILLVSVASFFTHVPNLLRETSRAKCLSLLITTMLPETNLALLLVVFYLPLLTDISGWTYSKNKNGRWKRITFADGRTLEVSEQEAEAAKEMLSYASNRLCAQKETGGNRSNINNMPGTEETWNPVINPAKTTYQKLVKVFMCMLIILFMMSYQILK